MLTLGQQLLAKKKKERDRIAVPSGVPAIDTSCFVKLVSADGHVFFCHKDCAAVSKVLKPLIYPELQQPGDANDLAATGNNDVVIEGQDDIAPPLVEINPPPKPAAKGGDEKGGKDTMTEREKQAAIASFTNPEENKKQEPSLIHTVVIPNLLSVGVGELADEAGATVIKFPYISGKLLEIVVQYFHYKQRYEHAADKRPPFVIEPAVALELLSVATKLQC